MSSDLSRCETPQVGTSKSQMQGPGTSQTSSSSDIPRLSSVASLISEIKSSSGSRASSTQELKEGTSGTPEEHGTAETVPSLQNDTEDVTLKSVQHIVQLPVVQEACNLYTRVKVTFQ